MNGRVARWKDMDRWVPGGGNDWECLHTLIPLEDLLTPRIERVHVKQTLDGWAPITIHFDGSVVPRERDKPFKGSMFAAYQKALDKAAKLDAQAHQIERDAQREFEAALGLTSPPRNRSRPPACARPHGTTSSRRCLRSPDRRKTCQRR